METSSLLINDFSIFFLLAIFLNLKKEIGCLTADSCFFEQKVSEHPPSTQVLVEPFYYIVLSDDQVFALGPRVASFDNCPVYLWIDTIYGRLFLEEILIDLQKGFCEEIQYLEQCDQKVVCISSFVEPEVCYIKKDFQRFYFSGGQFIKNISTINSV